MKRFVALVPFVLSGCMLATQKDVVQLDASQTRIQKSQADLSSKMTELSGHLESLNSQLETSQQRMTSLSQKLDDLQADLQRRFSVLTGQVTGTASHGASTPSDMLKLAQNDFQAGNFDLALVGFRNLLSQHPRSELAAQAQYHIGECELARKDFMDAAREFDKVIQHYSKSEYAPKALYKKGLALQQAGKKADAKETFQRLIKEYPRHELSRSAKDLASE
jgi:tol-pal system protein YbgF